MTSNHFNQVIEEQWRICTDTLGVKAQEYATDDRLHNFKQAAALEKTTTKKALMGMMAKHTISVYDMLSSNGEYVMELWDEKIKDSINYLLLLKAVLVEEHDECAIKPTEKPLYDPKTPYLLDDETFDHVFVKPFVTIADGCRAIEDFKNHLIAEDAILLRGSYAVSADDIDELINYASIYKGEIRIHVAHYKGEYCGLYLRRKQNDNG